MGPSDSALVACFLFPNRSLLSISDLSKNPVSEVVSIVLLSQLLPGTQFLKPFFSSFKLSEYFDVGLEIMKSPD